MENASQALIIAGAILLAILIIAIGMYIYNSASSTIQSSMEGMNSSEIESFNGNFENYRGNQQGTQISALISRLISNAATYQDEESRRPNVTAPALDNLSADHSDVAVLSQMKNKVKNKHKYNVEFEYDASTGLISTITINDAATGTGGGTGGENP